MRGVGAGRVRFYPYKKEGDGKGFSHAEGWGEGTNSFGVVSSQVFAFNYVEEGCFKRGGAKGITFLRGGGVTPKVSDP